MRAQKLITLKPNNLTSEATLKPHLITSKPYNLKTSPMKSRSKFEIAQAAGISTEVLRRWIMERRKEIVRWR